MIALEGPDGAGKSTLAQQLLKDHIVYKVLESPKRTMLPGESLLEATYRYLYQYANHNSYVVDRFIFSELVYGPILRGKIEFSHLDTSRVLLRLLTSPSFVIFCMPGTHRFKEDENPEVMEKIQLIRSQYDLWYETCLQYQSYSNQFRVLRYRWDMPGAYAQLNRKIIKAIHFPELLKKG